MFVQKFSLNNFDADGYDDDDSWDDCDDDYHHYDNVGDQ